MDNLPMPFNEKQRLKALTDYHIVDTLPEEEFDRLTELACLICDTPISLVSLLDDNRQWFKSKKDWLSRRPPEVRLFASMP